MSGWLQGRGGVAWRSAQVIICGIESLGHSCQPTDQGFDQVQPTGMWGIICLFNVLFIYLFIYSCSQGSKQRSCLRIVVAIISTFTFSHGLQQNVFCLIIKWANNCQFLTPPFPAISMLWKECENKLLWGTSSHCHGIWCASSPDHADKK